MLGGMSRTKHSCPGHRADHAVSGQVVKGLPVFDGRFGDHPEFAVCLHCLSNNVEVLPQDIDDRLVCRDCGVSYTIL